MTKASLGIIYLNLAEGFNAIGEYLYVADLDSLRVCPYEGGHATIMGYFQEKAPVQGSRIDVELCPRTLLKRVEEYVEISSLLIRVWFVLTEYFIVITETPSHILCNFLLVSKQSLSS
jgi:hypothetical protein